MLNALVTLPFLLILALAGVALWHTLSASAPKVLAALRGQSLFAGAAIGTRPVTIRYAPRQMPVQAPVRTAARLRAAA